MVSLSLDQLRSPPRRLSTGARIQVAFSGTIQFIGWTFLGMGLLFSSIFLGSSDFSALWIDEDEGVRRPGEIVSVEATSATVNDEPVMELRARYLDTTGQEREVSSYLTGHGPREGESVFVYDFPGQPEAAVIEGARRAPFGLYTLFILLFPTLGAIFVIARLRVQGRWVALLGEGESTRAVLESRERTATKVNNQPVMKLTFRYLDPQGGDHSFSVKTHLVANLGDEPHEAILYDPKRPALAVPLDLASRWLTQDPTGRIVAARPGRVVGLLLRPGIVLAIVLGTLLFV